MARRSFFRFVALFVSVSLVVMTFFVDIALSQEIKLPPSLLSAPRCPVRAAGAAAGGYAGMTVGSHVGGFWGGLLGGILCVTSLGMVPFTAGASGVIAAGVC